MSLALDTNLLWAHLGQSIDLTPRLEGVEPVCIPLPVVAEAHFAVLNSGRRRLNQARLSRFLAGCWLPEMGEETARLYAHVRQMLRQKGRPIPANDIWIAAVCLEHGVPLATRDAHFSVVDGLRTLDW